MWTLHQRSQLCCHGSTVKLAQEMKPENVMNLRLNDEGSTARGALGASSQTLCYRKALQLVSDFQTWPQCSLPAVISEAEQLNHT